MKIIRLVILLGILLFSQLSFSQQDIAGNWQGMGKMGPQETRFVVKFYRGYAGSWAGKYYLLDNPDIQSGFYESVDFQDSIIKLVVNGGQVRCQGKLSADGTSIDVICAEDNQSIPLKFQRANKDNAWKTDLVNHRVKFITVEKDVKLEVLDWGGSGRALILLAGLTADAHAFDKFAPKLVASGYHVYGISRRGIGESSIPLTGYSADRLGDDVLAVIKALKLKRPVLAGHSIAGEELSSIGSRHPENVAGLIYLDAAWDYAYYDESYADQFSARKKSGQEMPTPQLLIITGIQKYTDIKAPLLAIYAKRSVENVARNSQKVLDAIKKNIPSAKLVVLPNATHNIYVSNEAEVLSEMKSFIATLP